MEDNHVKNDASAGKDGGVSPVEPAQGAPAQADGDPVAQNNNSSGPPNDKALVSIHNELHDTKAAEDGGREDMFVDCPDEIENSESQHISEEKEHVQEDQSNESDSGIKVEKLMAELKLLRGMHEKSVTEKEGLVREHEIERTELMRELGHLCHQLKALNDQQTTPGENADGLVNHHQTEDANWDVKSASLHEMISQCSRLIKKASDERLQIEENVQDLNAKVAELSESNSSSKQEVLHAEEIVNRILAPLSITHHQEGSLTEKISDIEKSVTFLVDKYNLFVYGGDQLRECLHQVGADLSMTDEIGSFVMARDKIFELREKEENLYQNLRSLEDENKRLVEELEKQKSNLENVNVEIGRLSSEVEHEKNRYANTKEKLSMAVTKGKALVQQRDSLKQLLAEKTSELEKCSIELQEKSSALQETLAEKSMILKKCGEIISDSVPTEELQPMDITEKFRWLADENKSLKAISLQYHKLADALLLFDFPETVASRELDVRCRWLAESFSLSKEEAMNLQSEIAKTKEAADWEIDHLTASLSAETQEKSYLEAELEEVRSKYEANERLQHELAEAREAVTNEIDHLKTSLLAESQEKSDLKFELENLRETYEAVAQKEHLISLEKDKIVCMLLEATGLANDSQQEVHPEHSDMTTIVRNCLAKIKENTREPSEVGAGVFESFQSLLYITDQEMSLYKLMLEEDVLDRVQVSRLSDELEKKTQELNTLKDEKALIQENLEQLEDRCALLKEKLTMAVKKGKGLVQERENLKGALNEKNTEIDRLKSELQENLSRYTKCQEQVTKLSLDVERISLLETDVLAAKEHADQLEQYLTKSNSMLERVMESIESITTPTDLYFEEPIDKVKWIAGYLSEHEISKMEMEQELRKVKDESSSLASKLSDIQAMMKSLEEALSVAEHSRSQLLDEVKEIEVSKAVLEEELHKEKERASTHASKFEELSQSKRTLENALSLAEDNISRFMNERDIAEENRGLAEEQLQKLKEEFSRHIAKLVDAEKTIQCLEDALSQAQKEISLLAEENSKVQIGTADLDSEIKKIRGEADSHAGKLSEANLTIRSLEDALLRAENNMAELVQEKKNSEEKILALTSKLESCMEELAGSRGSIENQAVELSAQLSCLHFLLKDETLSSLLGHCFKRKFESLKNMDFLLKEMGNCFLEMDSDVLKISLSMEDDSSISTTLPSETDIALDMNMLNVEVNAVDSDSIMLHIEQMNEKFHLKDKILADKFDDLSSLLDETIAALLRRLHTTKDKIASVTKYTKSLEEQVKDMETDKQRQEDTIASLESEIRILLSSCTDATQRLESNVRKSVSGLRSIYELVKLEGKMSMDFGEVADDVKIAEKLLVATGQNQDLSELFQDAINKFMSIFDDMQNKVKETQLTCDGVLEERDLYRDKISRLETDLQEQQNLCRGMKIELDDYKEKAVKLKESEAELATSLSKIHETEDALLSASQVKSILGKMNEVEVPDAVFTVGDSHDSADVRKLFYVLDSFDGLGQKVSALSHDNKELQSTINKQIREIEFLKKQVGQNEELQSTIDEQILEIESLKKQVENHVDNKKKDSEKVNKLLTLESGLRNLVHKLGGSDLLDDPKVDGALGGSDLMDDPKVDWAIWLLPLLDKLVMAAMQESEDLKSKNEELDSKLLGTQKAMDDLSNKVKFLEDSNQASIAPSEIEQERGTSTAPLPAQSEISEMQDMAAIGKISNIPHVPSAAHVRTLRKGSGDHLAINIDSDSERLISNKESDEDKGHAFKSLNTSGLIPRQGRTVADRIDGIWVLGSRALMTHPRGRLGVIAYWLVLHIWLLTSVL